MLVVVRVTPRFGGGVLVVELSGVGGVRSVVVVGLVGGGVGGVRSDAVVELGSRVGGVRSDVVGYAYESKLAKSSRHMIL